MATNPPAPPAASAPVVDKVHDDTSDGFAVALAAHIAQLALAIDNPERILKNAVDWAKDNYAEKVYTAYWVTLTRTHERDKGFALDVAKLPLSLRLRILVGARTGGFGVFTPDYRFAGSMKASMGIGMVALYDDWRNVSPVASFAIHF